MIDTEKDIHYIIASNEQSQHAFWVDYNHFSSRTDLYDMNEDSHDKVIDIQIDPFKLQPWRNKHLHKPFENIYAITSNSVSGNFFHAY